MDAVTELWSWLKWGIVALLGLLGWYFKSGQVRIEKRLDGHDDDIAEHRHNMQQFASRTELTELREAAESRAATLDRDIKNLGQQLSEVVRRECNELRQSQERQNQAVNERLDKLLIIFTNSQNKGPH